MFTYEIGDKIQHKAHGLTAIVESQNTYTTLTETRYYYGVRFPDGRSDLWETKDVDAAP